MKTVGSSAKISNSGNVLVHSTLCLDYTSDHYAGNHAKLHAYCLRLYAPGKSNHRRDSNSNNPVTERKVCIQMFAKSCYKSMQRMCMIKAFALSECVFYALASIKRVNKSTGVFIILYNSCLSIYIPADGKHIH